MQRTTGQWERTTVLGQAIDAFVPAPLPPSPPLALTELAPLLAEAEAAVIRLDVASRMVPSMHWFIYGYVRKEAVLSSQIEGTQATLVDLFEYEGRSGSVAESEASLRAPDAARSNAAKSAVAHASIQPHVPPGIPPSVPSGIPADVEEVCNYLDALHYARNELAAPSGLPLSMRLLGEIHRRLLAGERGASRMPGEIRRTQNWIGGESPAQAAFVPPPPQYLGELLSQLETFIHRDTSLPPLVRAGLVHVQFETIHPYLDGNGRLGRSLITLLLEHWNVLSAPLLYLSLHFKRHRAEYYRRLDAVRAAGDWEGWTEFFLRGVASVAAEATSTASRLYSQIEQDRARTLGSATTSVVVLRLLERLREAPVVSVASVMTALGTTKPTAIRAIDQLAALGILEETTGRKRDRSFIYRAYVDILREGTD